MGSCFHRGLGSCSFNFERTQSTVWCGGGFCGLVMWVSLVWMRGGEGLMFIGFCGCGRMYSRFFRAGLVLKGMVSKL